MAFQRPFLISMKRSDGSQRWGFGITGGKEYGSPVRIQSVAEDSLAERYGLHEGDEVIQVGRVNVQDMSQGQVYEVLARCGNKIEMFVIREDLFAQRKGKEPPVVKAVVHNPYNSPLQLYSTENVAETLAKQTEVLTEGQILDEEGEGPENLSFKQKSAVFQLLEEQAKQDSSQNFSRGSPQRQSVVKPKVAPPPPPKPKPPSQELLYNGYDTGQRQVYQDQHKTSSRVEYQTTQKVVNQYQYQQEQPVQCQQTTVYQTNSYQKSPGYQSPVIEKAYFPGYQAPAGNYQQHNYQQTYQQSNYQQAQSPRSPVTSTYQQSQQYPGYQSPTTATFHPLNQVNYQQNQQHQQSRAYQSPQSAGYQVQVQTHSTQSKGQQSPTAVSKAEFKIGPPPPPRGSSTKQDQSNMAAVYKQQYEQHLQQQYEQQQAQVNHINDVGSPPKAHIIKENIFEHNSTSGTPITYKAPPAAPPKPNWPPPPTPEQFRSPAPPSPTSMRAGSVWPPKKSSVIELPRTGFNPTAVREGDTGRRCVWPPPKPEDEYRSGRSTPQSPVTGRRITWNPSPSPPTTRKAVFGASQSPSRRKDIQWPPPSPTGMNSDRDGGFIRGSPRLTRKARFEDYIKEHASINVPQTYRPPPGTQHVEYR